MSLRLKNINPLVDEVVKPQVAFFKATKVKNTELKNLAKQYLEKGIHGICFSAYLEGQKPGDTLSEAQISDRMAILRGRTKWVRTFSCTDGNELIPKVAKEHGIKTMVGAWLSDDMELNEKEINNLINVVKAGYADLVAVGNEVLYRKELTLSQLLTYIKRVKEALPNAQVGYVDAYYEFRNHPELAEACDVIFTNCYPFWEGCHIDASLPYMQTMYRIAVEAAKGKRVVISETGWPFAGSNFEASVPSYENALRYFINTQQWSEAENVEVMYFTSFDEAWKVDDEGDVGAYWGIWDKDGQAKFTNNLEV